VSAVLRRKPNRVRTFPSLNSSSGAAVWSSGVFEQMRTGAFGVSLWPAFANRPFGVVRTCLLLTTPRSERTKEERITEGWSWIDPGALLIKTLASVAEMLRLAGVGVAV